MGPNVETIIEIFIEFIKKILQPNTIWEFFKVLTPSAIALYAIVKNNNNQRERDIRNEFIKYKISIMTDLHNNISTIREKSLNVENALTNCIYNSDNNQLNKNKEIYRDKMLSLSEYIYMSSSNKQPKLRMYNMISTKNISNEFLKYQNNLNIFLDQTLINEDFNEDNYLKQLSKISNEFNVYLDDIENDIENNINNLFNEKNYKVLSLNKKAKLESEK